MSGRWGLSSQVSLIQLMGHQSANAVMAIEM
jgi:hypothetical protein